MWPAAFSIYGKYDLLNNGNFGTGGYQQIINEIEDTCSNEKCVFFVDERELTKDPDGIYNKNILIHVITHYIKKDKINGLTIYTNYQ